MGDVLVQGATIWAGVNCVPGPGEFLVRDGRIAAASAAGEPGVARVVDLPGAHVLPGFTDTHVHLTTSAWQTIGLDGRAWRTVDDALAAIGQAAGRDAVSRDAVSRDAVSRDQGESQTWLLCWNARPFDWPQRRLPTAAELDRVAPGRRVLVSGVDLHRGSLSSAGLATLDLTRAAHRLDVVTDRRGRAQGELWEEAYGWALTQALADSHPAPGDPGGSGDAGDPGEAERRVLAELARAARLGITHVHEAFVPLGEHRRMLTLADRAPQRLSWALGGSGGLISPGPPAADLPGGPYGASGPEVKLFLDGGDRCAVCMPARALPALTWAAVRQAWQARHPGPLLDAMRRRSRISGSTLIVDHLRYTEHDLTGLLDDYLAAGIRPRMHALGNLAVAQAARALSTAGAQPGAAVIDHLVLLDQATADQVAVSGAWAGVQPGFLESFGPQIVGGGTDRYLGVVAAGQLAGHGVPLVISSDHPAGPLDPLHNLRLAIRRTLPGGAVLQAQHALGRQAAVRAATTAAAASIGAPGATGLTAGEVADFVVCDGDPFDPATRVVQTWVAGRQIYG